MARMQGSPSPNHHWAFGRGALAEGGSVYVLVARDEAARKRSRIDCWGSAQPLLLVRALSNLRLADQSSGFPWW
ncbi:unnamed protein product [Diplocarpon coronariae]